MQFRKKESGHKEWTCQQSDWFDISNVGFNTAIVVSVKKGAKGFDPLEQAGFLSIIPEEQKLLFHAHHNGSIKNRHQRFQTNPNPFSLSLTPREDDCFPWTFISLSLNLSVGMA
jgi:hypothetical protein